MLYVPLRSLSNLPSSAHTSPALEKQHCMFIVLALYPKICHEFLATVDQVLDSKGKGTASSYSGTEQGNLQFNSNVLAFCILSFLQAFEPLPRSPLLEIHDELVHLVGSLLSLLLHLLCSSQTYICLLKHPELSLPCSLIKPLVSFLV